MRNFLQAVPLAALLLSSACSKDEYTTTSYSTVDSRGASIDIGGVKLEVAPDVRFESQSFSSTGQPSTFSSTLDGHDYAVEQGRLRVGNVEYGAVRPGDTVRISRAEGVSVNGEARGGLPRDASEGVDADAHNLGYYDADE